jgi:hypothetical protein
MDRIIDNLTPLSVETIKKPYRRSDQSKEMVQKILRKYEEAKTFKEYHNVAKCLYWIGKEQFNVKIRRRVSGHMLAQAKKVYALCSENPQWIGHMSMITIEMWTKININEARRNREQVKRVLDGARNDVGEDVNLHPSPDNPQQSTETTAAAAWDEVTRVMEDQFLIQGPMAESCDFEVTSRIGQPYETEEIGRTWEELMGISEDIPEINGLME